MPNITILSSDRKLTKKFFADGSNEPYPLVKEFTSQLVAWNDLKDLLLILSRAGDAGMCMQKGPTIGSLDRESRAGKIDTHAPTHLLVIDYDADTGFLSVEDMLMSIDPKLANTSYIFQHSASAGLFDRPAGLRGHVFVQLKEPVAPTILKQWFKLLNLTVDGFKNNISLAKNGMALRYPLDITINQNDKLVFLSPPMLPVDMEDPIKERFILCKGAFDTYEFTASVSAEKARTLEHAMISTLRDKFGLPASTPKYTIINQGELLNNPSQCDVTGVLEVGAYIRLNLNGGDSWAYWYHKDNPTLLYNFKGEPIVRLQDIAPEYYNHLMQQTGRRQVRPFVGRDPTTDSYFNGEYDQATGKMLALHRTSSKEKLIDFLVTRGEPRPRAISDWQVEFNPNTLDQINFEQRWVNLFNPTEFMTASMRSEMDVTKKLYFPTIEKVIRHVCVDEATFNHFMNWLAYIFQTRAKTQTAWVFSGTEGTGKGTLFHKILRPIFGESHAHIITQDQAMEQYNEYLRQNIILYYDEADMETTKEANKVLAKFRTVIADPVVPMRAMRMNTQQVRNFTNMIISSNQPIPIRIKNDDRRYNIAPRQEKRINLDGQYDKIEAQLSDFCIHLHKYPVDEAKTRVLVTGAAREALILNSRTTSEAFFDALRQGDLSYFTDDLRAIPYPSMEYTEFANVVNFLIDNVGKPVMISMEQLLALYSYITASKLTNKAFGWLCAKHACKFERMSYNGIRARYTQTTMHGDVDSTTPRSATHVQHSSLQ